MQRKVNQIIKKGVAWTDPEFPNCQKSLYDLQHDDVDEKVWSTYGWKRCSELFPSYKVFSDGIQNDDIL